MQYAELEISMHSLQMEPIDGEVGYWVELRFNNPTNDAERPPKRGECRINYEELLALHSNSAQYGAVLCQRIFKSESILREYREIKAVIQANDLLLRVRLLIGPTALRLHFLRWETLLDPDTNTPLATSEKILFSRFLASDNWTSIRLRPKKRLKALIAVSAPTGLGKYGLAEVDVAGEVARARKALEGIDTAVTGEGEALTLQRLLDLLRDEIDILYLVCHGALSRKQEPLLFFQDSTGAASPTNGAELAARVNEMTRPPRLALLISCESGAAEGAGNDEPMAAHAALAPRLAEAGIPAILAMQGKISMETVKLAMPVFLHELVKDGQIDRAMAVARGSVPGRRDSWMMALFLRLKSGQIWYEAGFTGGGSDFAKWNSLCRRVNAGKFIPILGPDLDERLHGGMQEVASKLAEQHTFPLRLSERSDVAKVLQYLAIEQDPDFAQQEFQKQLKQQIMMHNDYPANGIAPPTVRDVLDFVVKRHQGDKDDPYRILAELPASIFITASQETVLLKTVRAAGKTPEPIFCPWRTTATNHPVEPQPKQEPTKETPLVYHVFGTFSNEDSLVLTEDDFFDYLIAMSTYKLIPKVVRGSLVESSLLFLGFRLDDWTFRVLFRLIMALEGCNELRQYSHVGVQVNPDEHSITDVNRARAYMESYFSKSRTTPIIDIYWGSAPDFLRQLRDRLSETDASDIESTPKGAADGWF